MLMHKLLVLPLLAGSLIAGSAAFAQTAPASPAAADAPAAPAMNAHPHHKNKMMSALRELNLSDDQKTKIKGFMTSYRSSRSSANPETREALRGQIEGVLTADQRTQFEAEMKPHMEPAAAPSS